MIYAPPTFPVGSDIELGVRVSSYWLEFIYKTEWLPQCSEDRAAHAVPVRFQTRFAVCRPLRKLLIEAGGVMSSFGGKADIIF